MANVGEKGREGMDSVLKKKMNITDEQAEVDAAKIKAFRTSVGWFSSPACSLIYQVQPHMMKGQSRGGVGCAQQLAGGGA